MQSISLNVVCWSYFESFQIVWSVQIISHRILRWTFQNLISVASWSIWHQLNWLWILMCFIIAVHHAHLEHIDFLNSCWQVLQHQCQHQTEWIFQTKEKDQSILQVSWCQKEGQDHRIISDCWKVDLKYNKKHHDDSNFAEVIIQTSWAEFNHKDNDVDMMKLIKVIENLRWSRHHNITMHVRMMCRIWEDNFWHKWFCFNLTTFKWNRYMSEYIYVLNCCEYCMICRHSEHRSIHYIIRNCSSVQR